MKLFFMFARHFTGSQMAQAKMARHRGNPEWSYSGRIRPQTWAGAPSVLQLWLRQRQWEMFRLETGQGIAWEHEAQIFPDLQTLVSYSRIIDNADATWHLALCYHLGFGTSLSHTQAVEHAKAARKLGHTVSQVFGYVLQPGIQSSTDASSHYRERITNLLISRLRSVLASWGREQSRCTH
ncbi:hypothetical protein QBC33DRAFT_248465 [Phialemonium atrogriseum]|uniref:Uncharacterized protein n=1 Tax=Phialemonium atrogriseum TaxID=1093897 RepID=A0AAJ0FDH6_9PEZI|nr:uncharacterized protein QBC33DRAFT_248465 [Phialemonium atrogriseum]KAK1763257.1 hypothetical protein QBC33DRAFT_248465 [Phialemonium atrogriseum]